MGWWKQSEQGRSFEEESSLIWGDIPADIMSDAIDRINAAFTREWGRLPTEPELIAGVRFSSREV
jgi:hypothetical protein